MELAFGLIGHGFDSQAQSNNKFRWNTFGEGYCSGYEKYPQTHPTKNNMQKNKFVIN